MQPEPVIVCCLTQAYGTAYWQNNVFGNLRVCSTKQEVPKKGNQANRFNYNVAVMLEHCDLPLSLDTTNTIAYWSTCTIRQFYNIMCGCDESR